MNKWEAKIRFKEAEVHSDNFIKHKDGSKTKKPDTIGYNNEDLMLSDFMVWLSNTHSINANPIRLKNGTDTSELISIFHIENEGNSTGLGGLIQGAISKGKGKKKGVLDNLSLYLGIPNWMEFKLEDGTFSDEQLYFISLMCGWNIPVFIIRKFDFFKFVIEEVILVGKKLVGGIYTNIEQVKNACIAKQ